MSKINNKPIDYANANLVIMDNNLLEFSGKEGKNNLQIHKNVKFNIDETHKKIIIQNTDSKIKADKAMIGTTYRLLENAINGVNKKFEKRMIISGVGYKCELSDNTAIFKVGYTNPVVVQIPEKIEIQLSKLADEFTVRSVDKDLLGKFVHHLEVIRKYNPFTGYGIKKADKVYITKKKKAK